MATMDEFSLLGRQAPQCSQSTLLCRSIERFRSSSDFLTPCGESWRGLPNRSNRGTSATGANCRFIAWTLISSGNCVPTSRTRKIKRTTFRSYLK
jgi:hypothetical protein